MNKFSVWDWVLLPIELTVVALVIVSTFKLNLYVGLFVVLYSLFSMIRGSVKNRTKRDLSQKEINSILDETLSVLDKDKEKNN